MPEPGIEIRGLKEFRAALRAASKELPGEFRKGERVLAVALAVKARANASGGTRLTAKAASKITGSSSNEGAAVGSSGGIGNVAFWGANRHLGWYAKPRYANSSPQFPKWVGNSWAAGVAGQGPYVINYTIAENVPWILDEYSRVIDRVTRKAFPS